MRTVVTGLLAIITLISVSVIPANAQTLNRIQLDTVAMTPALGSALATVGPDTAAAFCAAAFRRYKYNVFVDSLRPAATPSNPDCAPREAVVLVRPLCFFTVMEFLTMRSRVLYVLILCRPNGMGIPLASFRDPSDRITEGQP